MLQACFTTQIVKYLMFPFIFWLNLSPFFSPNIKPSTGGIPGAGGEAGGAARDSAAARLQWRRAQSGEYTSHTLLEIPPSHELLVIRNHIIL